MTDKTYFAWINIHGCTYPEKWFGDQRKGSADLKLGGTDPEDVIQMRRLDQDEAELGLDELAAKYPCET